VARENKTKYAILGLLSWTPLTGYEMKHLYEHSAGFFWSISYGQIYPMLRRLEEEGLATRTAARGEGRPERNVYQITAAGTAALRAWLDEPADDLPFRSEVLLKVLHGFKAPPQTSIAQVERYRERVRAGEALRRETLAEVGPKGTGEFAAALPYWSLTARFGELVNAAVMQWCDEALAVLGPLETTTEKKSGGGAQSADSAV
jgi:PadR family transcriptional regulator, regulatory protein AphA